MSMERHPQVIARLYRDGLVLRIRNQHLRLDEIGRDFWLDTAWSGECSLERAAQRHYAGNIELARTAFAALQTTLRRLGFVKETTS